MAEDWIPVYGSSRVDAIQYDPERQECRVRFAKGGEIYVYYGVPQTVFDAFLHASSKGKFITYGLRGYAYAKEF